MSNYCAQCKASEHTPSVIELCEQHRLLTELWAVFSRLMALAIQEAAASP